MSNEDLQGAIGTAIGCLSGLCCPVVIILLFINGPGWAGETFFPWLFMICGSLFWANIALMPLFIWSRTRYIPATTIFTSSWMFWLATWSVGLLLLFSTWGLFWSIIGLALGGVGVIPLGLIATLFSGSWGAFWFLLALVFGSTLTRFGGAAALAWAEDSIDELKSEDIEYDEPNRNEDDHFLRQELLEPEDVVDALDTGQTPVEKAQERLITAFSAKSILDAEYELHTEEGKQLHEEGDNDAAIKCLSLAIEKDPGRLEAIWWRAAAYQEIDPPQLNNAIEDLTHCIELDPDDAEIYQARALLLLEIQDFERAFNDFTKIIEIDPECFTIDPIDSYGMRAEIFGKRGEWENAIAEYTEVLERWPIHKATYLSRANAYEQIGDTEQARLDLQRAEECND